MIIIGVIILFALLVVSAWNGYTLLQIKKIHKEGEKTTPEERYYELKFKIQFLVAMFTVFAAIVGLYGYNTLEDVKQKLTNELNDSIDSLKQRLETTATILNTKDSIVRILENDLAALSENVPKLKKGFNQIEFLERRIQTINGKNILKQNYYIVTSLSFATNDLTKPVKIYFKDLATNLGDKLPSFTRPPLIITVPDESIPVEVFGITLDSFTITPSSTQYSDRFPWDGKPIFFSILILER